MRGVQGSSAGKGTCSAGGRVWEKGAQCCGKHGEEQHSVWEEYEGRGVWSETSTGKRHNKGMHRAGGSTGREQVEPEERGEEKHRPAGGLQWLQPQTWLGLEATARAAAAAWPSWMFRTSSKDKAVAEISREETEGRT